MKKLDQVRKKHKIRHAGHMMADFSILLQKILIRKYNFCYQVLTQWKLLMINAGPTNKIKYDA